MSNQNPFYIKLGRLCTQTISLLSQNNVELISNNSIGTICPSKIEKVKSEYLLPNTKTLNKGNIFA
jgi:hypothetical protein